MNITDGASCGLSRCNRLFEVTEITDAYFFLKKPNFEPYWECYDFTQIILVRGGTGTYHTRERSYRFGPGMMIYRPAGKHSLYEWDGNRAALAVIDFVCPSPAMAIFGTEPLSLSGEESAALFELAKFAASLCEGLRGKEKPREPSLAAQASFSYLYASLERFLSMLFCHREGIDLLTEDSEKAGRAIAERTLAREVESYLRAHVGEKLSVADIAAHFWLGQTTLAEKFRRITGESLLYYFIGLKIEEAARRIAAEPATFTEIAEQLGFSSVNYFSKVFKARMGMTPTEYSRYAEKRNRG